MQETLITMDAALCARLQALRPLLLRLDAGTAEGVLRVKMPDGEEAPLGLAPEKGLRAAGALVAYALLGGEDDSPLSKMDELAQDHPDRSIRRACQVAAMMLREDPAFSQAALYAALRTATVFLPESAPAAELPGLIQRGESARSDQSSPPADALRARYALAGSAAIAYFDLPPGVEECRVCDSVRTRAQCRAGVCLPPDCDEIPVEWAGGSALLRPGDPLAGLRFSVGFRLGRLFVPAKRVPTRLWGKRAPWVRVRGGAGKTLPALALISSLGVMQEPGRVLAGDEAFLRCPPLDPRKDDAVLLRAPGARYLDWREEG